MLSDYEEYLTYQKDRQKLNVETGVKCSLQCPQCRRANLHEPKDSNKYKLIKHQISVGDFMPMDSFMSLLEWGQDIAFNGTLSDPIFHPNLEEMISTMREWPDVDLVIHTAATHKDLEYYRRLFELSGPNVKWKLGMDGLPGVSEIYRIGQDSNLMFDAIKLAASMGVNVEWHYIIFEYNEYNLEECKQIANDIGVKLMTTITNRNHNGFASPEHLKPQKHNKIIVKQ